MGIAGGPNILGDENLVFMYDIADTENSYLGEPTTNLASNLGLGGMSGITLTYLGLDEGWKKYSMSGTFTGGTYPYIMFLQSITFTGGVSYSTQAIVKTNVLSKFNYFGSTGVSYVNQPLTNQGTMVQSTLSDGSSYVARFNFAYTSNATQTGYLYTNPINNTTFVPSTDFVWLKDFQIEQKDRCTPYTPTSRSISGSLFDISANRNTITLTNVSYINGQPSFDGTDDYINLLTNIQSGFTAATYEFVCYPTSIPGTGAYRQLYIQETSTWIALYNPSGTPAFGIDLNNGAGWFDNNGGFTTGARTTSTITANKFYHLVFSWSSSTVSVYLNGSLQSTVSTLQAANGRQNVSTLGIGTTSRGIGSRYSGASSNFAGSIPLIRFYNKGLSSQEVYNNYIIQKARFGL